MDFFWIFGGLDFFLWFFCNFFFQFSKGLPIRLTTRIRSTDFFRVKLLNSFASFILNKGFTPIRTHSSSSSFSTFFYSFFLPLFILHISNLALLLFSISIRFKISKSPNHQTLTLLKRPFLTFLQFLVNCYSAMALKVGSKCKRKEPIREDSPPQFDYS